MLTFKQAEALFKKARSKERGYRLPGRQGSTRLVRRGDSYGVLFHATVVVRIHRDNTYTLSNGGYFTPSTKERINTYGPRYLSACQNRWTFSGLEFQSGLRFTARGRCLNYAGPSRAEFSTQLREERNQQARLRRETKRILLERRNPALACDAGRAIFGGPS